MHYKQYESTHLVVVGLWNGFLLIWYECFFHANCFNINVLQKHDNDKWYNPWTYNIFVIIICSCCWCHSFLASWSLLFIQHSTWGRKWIVISFHWPLCHWMLQFHSFCIVKIRIGISIHLNHRTTRRSMTNFFLHSFFHF